MNYNGLTYVARCFAAGTMISTPYGDQAVETLVAGDEIISYNEAQGVTETATIGAIDITQSDDIYIINHKTVTTGTHPFYTTDGIKEVADLKVGDKLINLNDTTEEITSINRGTAPLQVYNLLNVTPNHNYYADQHLVHNKGGCFLAGTKVRTPWGETSIEKLEVGDLVISQNELSRQEEQSAIGRIDVLHVRGYYVINGHLKVTGTHPIYVRSGIFQALCNVENLRLGHEMITDAGTQEVRKIEWFDKEVTVYNLIDVAPNHNYFANNILVHNKGGGGRGGFSGGRSSSSSKSSSTSNKSKSSTSSSSTKIEPAKPRVGTSTAKPGSKIKTADGKEVISSAKAPTNKKFTSSKGVVGDNGYAPRFNNGYNPPAGSVVYYPQHSALDYLPWIYLFSQDSPQNDQTVIVQPDGKEVTAQPVREGADGLAVFNWFILIVMAIAIIGGIIWAVNKATTKPKPPEKRPSYGW